MSVGIIGGGQLGMFLIKSLLSIDRLLRITVIDPSGDKCCCANIPGVEIIKGDLYDRAALEMLVSKSDILTAEIEHFDWSIGHEIRMMPSYKVFSVISNKRIQKEHLASFGVPVVPSQNWSPSDKDIFSSLKETRYVVKCPTKGYDGNGVFMMDNPKSGGGNTLLNNSNGMNLNLFYERIREPLIIEEYLNPSESVELSVIVVVQEETTINYDPVVMDFYGERNILGKVQDRSDEWVITEELKQLAVTTAIQAAQSFKSDGLFAVEMFYSFDKKQIFVNEVAPRVHNSGHHTLDTHDVSQFEMMARLILRKPIVEPKCLHPYFKMVNLLGDFTGPYRFVINGGVPADNLFVYDYGKDISKKWRKLGHFTIIYPQSCDAYERVTNGLVTVESQNVPQIRIGIVMGSQSDAEVMKKASETLSKMGIRSEISVVSAHRTPERLREYARTAYDRGIRVIIAGAGGAAHLPGMVAAFAPGVPVIGVPISNSNGVEALYSIVAMPPGVPVACMAVNGAINAAIYAAQMLPEYHQSVVDYRKQISSEVKIRVI